MIETIVKRDGRHVKFEKDKITGAILNAFATTKTKISKQQLEKLIGKIINRIGKKEIITVEEVQDIVEDVLLKEGYTEVGRNYIHYRDMRTAVRDKNNKIHKMIDKIIIDTDRENANVGTGPSAKLLQIAEAEGQEYAYQKLISSETKEAIDKNIIHIHDFAWAPLGTTTCVFAPLGKLLSNGFSTDHGFIRPPKRIKSAAALACIILQSSQNDQHGGQSFGWFDRDMAPFVAKEFEWQKEHIINGLKRFGVSESDPESINEEAWNNTREETFQQMESIVFNLNTMHSRAGAQVPFSSINLGTDTSREGRLITEMLLKSYNNGLGNGEQPLFPIIIFKVKKGINADPGDPNYDLFKLSMKVSANRLFPNYIFQDSSFNKDFPGDIPTMGCRTRVSWNINKPVDEQTCEERGNLSFTSINIVNLALRAKYKNEGDSKKYHELCEKYKLKATVNNKTKKFFILFDHYIDVTIKQLYERFEYQCGFKKKDFPFLLSGVWMDSDKLNDKSSLRDILKNGTLSVGFIGLAETLKCLTGHHHAEDVDSDELGESIVRFMRQKTDEATKKYHLNYALLATPAEGLSGKFIAKDKKIFGIVPGVTDKEWYTNSFHCPVEYNMTIKDKIRIEGKYHKYCNAGQISYIELDSDIKNNIPAYESILRYMMKNDMGYVAVNFPVDRCRECNYMGQIENSCPKCGSQNISRIRRITGYLAELDMFNKAKLEETLHRKKHLYTTA